MDLHPWNRDFTWQPGAPPYRTLSPAQAAAFDRDGFLVLPEVFDAATVAEVVAGIDRFEAEVDALLASRANQRMLIAEAGAITFTTPW